MLDLQSFKALSSDTRLLILKALDGKKMGLKDLSRETRLSKATLHEHLQKLTDAELIKKKQRPGHKWVYYKLSWKGSTLLHPENNRVLLLFASSFAALSATIYGCYQYIQSITPDLSRTGPVLLQNDGTLNKSIETFSEPTSSSGLSFPLSLTVVFCILFIIFISITIWRYQKNKEAKL